MNRIEKFYAQKKCWKIEKLLPSGKWSSDAYLGDKAMRHGEANIHVKSAKLLGHPKLRIVKIKGRC
jgi:hypothetical protein